jgi:hypothetical protein
VAKAGAPIALDSSPGDKFDGIVFAERNVNRWMNGSSGFQRTPTEQFDQAEISEEKSLGNSIMLAITYQNLGDGQVQITGYRNGALMGQYDSGNFASWVAGEQEVLFGPRHTSPVTNATNGALDALVHEARLYGKAGTADEILALYKGGPLGGETIAFTDIVVNTTAGTVDVTWVSSPGKTYRLEYSDTLATWTEDTDNYPPGGATGARTTYRFTGIPAAVSKRFFRASEE